MLFRSLSKVLVTSRPTFLFPPPNPSSKIYKGLEVMTYLMFSVSTVLAMVWFIKTLIYFKSNDIGKLFREVFSNILEVKIRKSVYNFGCF